jgi:Brp/Blh family beta-carotene 15,15'-monooxygenase
MSPAPSFFYPMSKETFIFIVSIIVLLQLEQVNIPMVEHIELVLCSILILTLGVSHGGIDNLLHQTKIKVSNAKFISYYLLVAAINVLLWIFSPNLGFILFILISAYHFGQSQFIEYNFGQHWSNKVLYFLWGGLLLVGLVFFKNEEVSESLWYQNFSLPSFEYMIQYAELSFWVLLASTVGMLLIKIKKGEMHIHGFLIETYQFVLICLAFKLFSLVLGFTLYFIILHSLKVLNHEYDYLKSRIQVENRLAFIKLLLPFTLISLVGLGIITGIILYFDFNVSFPLLALILTSSVTLPHTYVMDVFYDADFKWGKSINTTQTS